MDGVTKANCFKHLRNRIAEVDVPEVFLDKLCLVLVALAPIDSPCAARDGGKALIFHSVKVSVYHFAIDLDVAALSLEDCIGVWQVVEPGDILGDIPGGDFLCKLQFALVLGLVLVIFVLFAHAVLGLFLISLNRRSNSLKNDFLKFVVHLLGFSEKRLKRAFLCDF